MSKETSPSSFQLPSFDPRSRSPSLPPPPLRSLGVCASVGRGAGTLKERNQRRQVRPPLRRPLLPRAAVATSLFHIRRGAFTSICVKGVCVRGGVRGCRTFVTHCERHVPATAYNAINCVVCVLLLRLLFVGKLWVVRLRIALCWRWSDGDRDPGVRAHACARMGTGVERASGDSCVRPLRRLLLRVLLVHCVSYE